MSTWWQTWRDFIFHTHVDLGDKAAGARLGQAQQAGAGGAGEGASLPAAATGTADANTKHNPAQSAACASTVLALLEPISRVKYPVLTADEELVSLPLQVRACVCARVRACACMCTSVELWLRLTPPPHPPIPPSGCNAYIAALRHLTCPVRTFFLFFRCSAWLCLMQSWFT